MQYKRLNIIEHGNKLKFNFNTIQNDLKERNNMREIIKDNEKSKLVHDPLVARALLRRGCEVIDCKPLKNDKKRSVLVFRDTPKFRKHLSELYQEWQEIDVATQDVEDPRVARTLLKRGMTLVDYKETKVDDKNKMVFVFEQNDAFQKELDDIVSDLGVRIKRPFKSEVEFVTEVDDNLD
jgi:hypothetical protein